MSQPNPPGYRPPMPQYGKSQLSDGQQKRQRAIIGGVLGCLGVLMLLTIVAGFFAFRAVKGTLYSGPTDRATMQQTIGPDVPLYPNGTVDELMTRTMMSTTGVMGKMIKPLGAAEPVSVALETDDTEDAVYEYYRRELTAQGWQGVTSPGTARRARQESYAKGRDQVLIQIQDHPQSPKKRMIILMRMQVPGPGGARPGSEAPSNPGDLPSGGWPKPGEPGGPPPQFAPPPIPAPGR